MQVYALSRIQFVLICKYLSAIKCVPTESILRVTKKRMNRQYYSINYKGNTVVEMLNVM